MFGCIFLHNNIYYTYRISPCLFVWEMGDVLKDAIVYVSMLLYAGVDIHRVDQSAIKTNANINAYQRNANYSRSVEQ